MNRSDQQTLLTASQFTDRVMTAVSLLPAPTPTRSFVVSIRARTLRDAVATLWVAWHLGTVRSWHVAPSVRARSFALVLAVASFLTTGSLAAAAAVHSVVPQRDERNPIVMPSGSSVDQGPAGNGGIDNEEPQPSHEPAESDAPTPSVHRAVTTQAPKGPDAGHHPTSDGKTDAEDHRGSGDDNATDHKDSSDGSDDAHDGSDGNDQPGATDDHDGSDGSGGTGEPDDHARSDGGSSGGSDDAPDGGGSDSGGDGSGG